MEHIFTYSLPDNMSQAFIIACSLFQVIFSIRIYFATHSEILATWVDIPNFFDTLCLQVENRQEFSSIAKEGGG